MEDAASAKPSNLHSMNYLKIALCLMVLSKLHGQTAYQGGVGSAFNSVLLLGADTCVHFYGGSTGSAQASTVYDNPFLCGMFSGDSTSGTASADYLSGQDCIFFKGSTGSSYQDAFYDNPAACPAFYASANGGSAYDARSYTEDEGICYFVALPIEASPLFAKIEQNDGVLYWTTYAELNNSGFEIQKSYDAIEWETIGWVNGAGDYQGALQYEYIDRNLSYQNQYYRTIQFDYDGTATISNVVNLHPSQSSPKQNHIAIYPNPLQSGNTLKVRSWLDYELKGSLSLYSTLGQLMHQQQFTFDNFSQLVELELSHLPSGHYFLIIQDVNGEPLNKQKIVIIP